VPSQKCLSVFCIWNMLTRATIHPLFLSFVIYCPSYTTQWCKDCVMQQLTKLHVSTLWGHLQAYKIWYRTRYFCVATYGIPWFTVCYLQNLLYKNVN
jgi:hypothetical protein